LDAVGCWNNQHIDFNIAREDMRQRGSNFASGDSHDIDGDSSIEPKNTEERGNDVVDDAEERERGNPVAHDGGESFISTHVQEEACNTEQGIRVRDHLAEIIGSRLNKYKGVQHKRGHWVARIWKRRDDEQKTGARITLGTFPTAEMAAIAYDAAVLHSRGASSFKLLNFPRYVSAIKSIVEGCSPSEATDFRCVARKAATELAPLISQEQKHEGLEASSLISQEQKHEGVEVSAAMSAVITGMHDQILNLPFCLKALRSLIKGL
jgi:hypothetical protein